MSGKFVYVRMLVGREPGMSPFVLGCMDEGTWEVIDEDEENRYWLSLKEKWVPDHGEFDWRVVRVGISREAIGLALDAPVMFGEVIE